MSGHLIPQTGRVSTHWSASATRFAHLLRSCPTAASQPLFRAGDPPPFASSGRPGLHEHECGGFECPSGRFGARTAWIELAPLRRWLSLPRARPLSSSSPSQRLLPLRSFSSDLPFSLGHSFSRSLPLVACPLSRSADFALSRGSWSIAPDRFLFLDALSPLPLVSYDFQPSRPTALGYSCPPHARPPTNPHSRRREPGVNP